MPNLTITSREDLGPISVDILAADGSQVNARPIVLSSQRQSAVVGELVPGRYTLVGIRPTGETLTKHTEIGSEDRVASFEVRGRSPHGFLAEASARGLVPRLPADRSLDDLGSIRSIETPDGLPTLSLAGAQGQTLRALRYQGVERLTGLVPADAGRDDTVPGDRYAVVQWRLDENGWTHDPSCSPEVRLDYLQVRLSGGDESARAFAVGLLDENGFGPVVIAPVFKAGISLTFNAEALLAGGAERARNPGTVRTPVALAVPHDPALADLLGGLAAGSLPGATALFEQGMGSSLEDARTALDFVTEKSRDSGAALLGAHFLTRFSRRSLPVEWVRDLARRSPAISDGWTLLATQLIALGGPDPETTRSELTTALLEASRVPTCVLGRTRPLLAQAWRLYMRDRPMPEDFGRYLAVGAEAGGLEAFWGRGPLSPGAGGPPTSEDWVTTLPDRCKVDLVGEFFRPL